MRGYLSDRTRASFRRSAVHAIPAPIKIIASVAPKLPDAIDAAGYERRNFDQLALSRNRAPFRWICIPPKSIHNGEVTRTRSATSVVGHECELPTALSNVRVRGAKRKTYARRENFAF